MTIYNIPPTPADTLTASAGWNAFACQFLDRVLAFGRVIRLVIRRSPKLTANWSNLTVATLLHREYIGGRSLDR